MPSIRCAVCHTVTEMRRYRMPPYRRVHADIADAIKIEQPGWEITQGFCHQCARRYRARIEEREQIAEDILSALMELPSLEKKVFVFYHYQGLKTGEIAARLRMDPGFVREALSRATKSLHFKLHPHIDTAVGIANRPSR